MEGDSNLRTRSKFDVDIVSYLFGIRLLKYKFCNFEKTLKMNIQAEKLKLIEWITKVQDFKTIEKVLKIQNEDSSDWWDELTDFEKKEIELGLADIEQGNTVEHSEARKIYEKYL